MSKKEDAKPLHQRLKGYLMSTVIEFLRAQKKVYRDMSEAEQRSVINRFDEATSALVVEAVDEIAARGFEAAHGTLEGLTIKDEVKAQVKLLKSNETLQRLANKTGTTVMIVCAEPREFLGGAIPQPEPDQRAMDPETGEIK